MARMGWFFMTFFLSILERSWVGHFWHFFLKFLRNITLTIFSTYNPNGRPFYTRKNASIFGSFLGSKSLTLYYFVPRLVDYLVWLFGESLNLSHFSWLCFSQHLLCPIEAIFQKKKNLKFWRIKKMFLDRSDIKGSPLWKKDFENHFFTIFL